MDEERFLIKFLQLFMIPKDARIIMSEDCSEAQKLICDIFYQNQVKISTGIGAMIMMMLNMQDAGFIDSKDLCMLFEKAIEMSKALGGKDENKNDRKI